MQASTRVPPLKSLTCSWRAAADPLRRIYLRADIYERQTSKGLMVFVITDIDYLDKDGNLVARVKRPTIRR
jgi:hypothetical protein